MKIETIKIFTKKYMGTITYISAALIAISPMLWFIITNDFINIYARIGIILFALFLLLSVSLLFFGMDIGIIEPEDVTFGIIGYAMRQAIDNGKKE